jgi:hypothetical protein
MLLLAILVLISKWRQIIAFAIQQLDNTDLSVETLGRECNSTGLCIHDSFSYKLE